MTSLLEMRTQDTEWGGQMCIVLWKVSALKF
jgi:hypothetical protein